MATLYGTRYSRRELMARIGDISQVAGVKKVRLADGRSDGVETYLFKTGSGLNFTVLGSRGLDISSADWCGRSLCWKSQAGEAAPQYYDEPGMGGWLRNWYGGLLVTCGFTYAGLPDVDQGVPLGLHGRASNTPASNACCDSEWQGDEYVMWVQGKVRESAAYGEDVVLTRRIATRLGESSIRVDDSVENLGHESTPHMFLYHINGGFPAVDAGSSMLSPTMSFSPRNEDAELDRDIYDSFGSPESGFQQRVSYHDMASEADGTVLVALANRNIPGGFGFYIKYNLADFPVFTECKMSGLGTYMACIEPGNCRVEGRSKERENGTLQMLEPGDIRKYKLEIGVLASMESIAQVEQRIAAMKRR